MRELRSSVPKPPAQPQQLGMCLEPAPPHLLVLPAASSHRHGSLASPDSNAHKPGAEAGLSSLPLQNKAAGKPTAAPGAQPPEAFLEHFIFWAGPPKFGALFLVGRGPQELSHPFVIPAHLLAALHWGFEARRPRFLVLPRLQDSEHKFLPRTHTAAEQQK